MAQPTRCDRAKRSVGGWVANPEEKTMAKKAAKGAKKKAAKKR